MQFENTIDFAKSLNEVDELAGFRQQFIFPNQNGKEYIYLCGNFLGIQPKRTKEIIAGQLANCGSKAVEGWFEGEDAWMYYHKRVNALLAKIVDAKETEVCAIIH